TRRDCPSGAKLRGPRGLVAEERSGGAARPWGDALPPHQGRSAASAHVAPATGDSVRRPPHPTWSTTPAYAGRCESSSSPDGLLTIRSRVRIDRGHHSARRRARSVEPPARARTQASTSAA